MNARGPAYVCGGQPHGGENDCGLYFVDDHLLIPMDGSARQVCDRCHCGDNPFEPTPDRPEWIRHKLTDPSWQQWRDDNPEEVAKLKAYGKRGEA